MRADRARVGRYVRASRRWARLLLPSRRRPGLRVFYGHDVVPEPGEPVAGGTAKFQRLATRFPNSPTDFTVLYLGSTWLPRDLEPLLRLARRRRIPIVINQDGVAYRAWAGDDAGSLNRPLRRALHAADHVLYQSEFSKLASDLFLGEVDTSSEILPNAVDLQRFMPARESPAEGPVLLLGGDQTEAYRLELGIRTFSRVLQSAPAARLLVTGRLVSQADPLLHELGVRDRVELIGRYAQRDAPDLMRRAHLLLHTQVNDVCPSVVIEAMACGLPVVYPASGGTAELVGDEAGIGVPHPRSWERHEPPSPEVLAEAVAQILSDLPRYCAAARNRALERFDVNAWLARHAELFAGLVG